jgi:hypothetical protein
VSKKTAPGDEKQIYQKIIKSLTTLIILFNFNNLIFDYN